MSLFNNLMSKLNLESLVPKPSVDQVVGVDIGTSSIKLVEIKKKGGKAVLETYSTLALGPYAGQDVGAITNLPQDVLAKAITDALKEGSISTKEAVISVPSSASLIFILEMPSAISEKELPSIIPTEARKYIPVPVSEVTLDYWVIPKQQTGFYEENEDDSKLPAKSEVLTVAIHNDTIGKYRDLTTKTELNTDTYEIEIFSSIRSTFTHELSAVMLVDFGASKTKLAIVEYGIVRSFHIVNKGSYDITSNMSKSLGIPFNKAEDLKREVGLVGSGTNKQASDVAKLTVDYINSEISSTIANFERKYQKPISKIILTGAGALLPGYHSLASEVFKTEVVMGNPFDKVEVPAFIANVLKETGPEFAVALGLALRKLG